MKAKVGLVAIALGLAAPRQAETLTNNAVVMLAAAGLDAETIIAKIRSSDTKFDLSAAQLVALKKKGVPSAVIAAMLDAESRSQIPGVPAKGRVAARPASPGSLAINRPAGIYLLSNGALTRIEPNVSGQTKTGGFLGSALTYGIAKISTKLVLQGTSARVATSQRSPTFYFYLPGGAAHASTSSFEQQGTEPTSPNQFSLVRLEKKKASRESRIAATNISGSQSGVVGKDRINFTYEEVRPGVYTVTPATELEQGEYCFVMIGLGGSGVARFFDFSVQ